MADIFDKEKRSKVMGLVKHKNTKPEIILRKALHALGFRFRIHDKKLPGKPDIKLTKYKTLIFVNGCFWHAHNNCKYYTIPKNNNLFWVEKIDKNIQRDLNNYSDLGSLGWKVIVVWTCDLSKSKLQLTLNRLEKSILSSKTDVRD